MTPETLPSRPLAGDAAPFRVVAIGSSAGGLQALTAVLELLPASFPAAVAVAQHMDPRHPSLLVGLLARRTNLTVRSAEQGLKLDRGVVYVAPPDHHLVVEPNGRMILTRGAKVQFVRPAVNVLFKSVATSCCARAAAVVLSGTGHDGSDGCREIKRCGGYVIVQDEATSEFPGMPQAARQTGLADEILPLIEIAPALILWASSSAAAAAGGN